MQTRKKAPLFLSHFPIFISKSGSKHVIIFILAVKLVELLQDFEIPFQQEGHKHCRPGWVNMECPFCTGNPGLHLGYCLKDDYFRCWRCGWHSIPATIAKLAHIDIVSARKLIKTYGGRSYVRIENHQEEHKPFELPTGVTSLTARHKKYLQLRGFDPTTLEQEWSLRGTGPVSSLDDYDYKLRILIPIYWDDKMVSFQTRDITNKALAKYKACPKDREITHHKKILYGKQEEWGLFGICVEGVTDVWRLGSRAFATFGINYKMSQVRVITTIFKSVAVVFDDDPQAKKQAEKLVMDLELYGIQAWQVTIASDPGSLTQNAADQLVKDLIVEYRRKYA